MTTTNLYLEVPAYVKRVCSLLQGAGYEAYIVGGCVRDRLLGREPHDWDVTTNATPTQVYEAVERSGNSRWYIVPTGEKYGTLTLLYPMNCGVDPDSVEVTTYRLDGEYTDGRRPDSVVFGTSLEEDVKRRDFTVNALAYDPVTETLVDYVNGQFDLEAKVLTTVGDAADRFREDGLRVLRAVRFACQLRFELSMHVQKNLKGEEYTRHLSAERVRDELFKILGSDRAKDGIKTLAAAGVLNVWLPEWKAMYAQEQNMHHAFNVWDHTMEALLLVGLGRESEKSDALLRFTTLLHDVAKPVVAELKDECRNHNCGLLLNEHWDMMELYDFGDDPPPPYNRARQEKGCTKFLQGYSFVRHEDVGANMAEEICRRFKLSGEQTHYVTSLIREHLFYYDSGWSDAAVRRFVKRVPLEYLDDLFTMCKADRLAHGYYEDDKHKFELIIEFKRRCKEQLSYKPPLKVNDLAVTGTDVMEHLGIGPGPAVGVELKRLQELVLDDPSLNEKHLLISLIRKP